MQLPQPITVKVKTITPIWTGDAQGKTSYVKGTSLVGGLRFWTEALLRSFGGKPCDITTDRDSNSRCIYDPKAGKKEICPACEIFGCTGKARSFMLRVSDEGMQKKGGGKVSFFPDI